MDGQKDLLLSALDLMLIIVVTLIIGVLAIRFIPEKGIGKNSIIPIRNAIIKEESDIDKKLADFTAIVLYQNRIELMKIEEGEILTDDEIESIENLKKRIATDEIYVVYEEAKSDIFSDVIRALINRNISFYIAKNANT